MADTGEARSAARDAVVRPLSRVAGRPCARPGCPSPARATLSFAYAGRDAVLEALADEASPATYDLCAAHADRTRPPSGWQLRDRRPVEDQTADVAGPARDLGDEHTVAVLAAALRAVPEAPAPVAADVLDEVEALDGPDDVDDVEEGVPLVDDLAEVPAAVREDVRDALAELAAVARGDDGPEQIAIELDDEPRPTPAPRPGPAPRPVPAARERGRDAGPGGPARAW